MKLIWSFLVLALGWPLTGLAQREGDTLIVNLFEFEDHRSGGYARWFTLPPDDASYERLWLQYRLRCPEWRCGQWDYLAHLYLGKPTGQRDSSGNPIQDRYEIGRYITPYGSQLPPDWDFTWYFDVTDYLPLLRDSVFINCNSLFYSWIPGGFSQLLELKLLKIKGTPVRQPLAVERLWHGTPAYGIEDRPFDAAMPPRVLNVPPTAAQTRYKLRVTGHGFGDMENCAEFCRKWHGLEVDGQIAYRRVPWRPDCGLNPVFPQNGTWVYDRAGWCPGDAVGTFDLELTPWVRPGQRHELSYVVQPYTSRRRPGVDNTMPYWMIETQAVYYGPPSHAVDAAIEEIISPSTKNVYSRRNPLCDRPVVVIRNTGSDTLRSLTLRYGTTEGRKYRHSWTGALAIDQTDTVVLGPLEWGRWAEASTWFEVEVSEPNGQPDPYPRNNRMRSRVEAVPRLSSPLEIILVGNRAARENSWSVRDANDSLWLWRPRGSLPNEAQRRDTLDLPLGCYRLTIDDLGGDGLDFGPYNNAGRGNILIRSFDGSPPRYLNPNFGRSISLSFTVGYDMNNDTLNLYNRRPAGRSSMLHFDLRPNPAADRVQVQALLARSGEVLSLEVLDARGQTLRRQSLPAADRIDTWLDVADWAWGLYLVRLVGAGWSESRRLIVQP